MWCHTLRATTPPRVPHPHSGLLYWDMAGTGGQRSGLSRTTRDGWQLCFGHSTLTRCRATPDLALIGGGATLGTGKVVVLLLHCARHCPEIVGEFALTRETARELTSFSVKL